MKTKTQITLTLLTLGSAATMLLAQDGPPPGEDGQAGPRPGGHRPPPPIIAALDANHDGVIDAHEIANAPTALKKLDKNGDGKLTADELRPPRPEGAEHSDGQGDRQFGAPGDQGHRHPLPPVMAALDANHDGVIDADEIANAPAALKALDKNNDGKLTRDELRPPRPEDGSNGPGGENRPDGPGDKPPQSGDQ